MKLIIKTCLYWFAAYSFAVVLPAQSQALVSVSLVPAGCLAKETPQNTLCQLRFTRSGSTATDLKVNFSINATSTATKGIDYRLILGSPGKLSSSKGCAVAVSGTELPQNSICIPAGSATANVNVAPLDDAPAEPTESITVAPLASPGVTVFGGTKTVYLQDNDTVVSIDLSSSSLTAIEAGQVQGTVRFSRTGTTVGDLLVSYGFSGTASMGSGADFMLVESTNAPIGKVLFRNGFAYATVSVKPELGNAINEPGETITLTILPDSAYKLGSTTSATVRICELSAPCP